MRNYKIIRMVALCGAVALMLALCACQPPQTKKEETATTLPISFYFEHEDPSSFNNDSLAIQTAEKQFDVDIHVTLAPLPSPSTIPAQYLDGSATCDVFLYKQLDSQNLSTESKGRMLNLSEYKDLLPNFYAAVADLGLENEVAQLEASVGGLYYLPTLSDQNLFDCGLIVRQDVMRDLGFETINTYDQLYQLLSAYKKLHPDTTPMTMFASPNVFFNRMGPCFGYSYTTSSSPLYYNYEKGQYVSPVDDPGYKTYLQYLTKLTKEGLLDMSFDAPIENALWSEKMSSGTSIATMAYYDQIAGLEKASTIPGFELVLLPPPDGGGGSHADARPVLRPGLAFPASITQRDDFEELLRRVDKLFYSDEAQQLWHLGVLNDTYHEVNGEAVPDARFLDDGGYLKKMQSVGCGIEGWQMVWRFEDELRKYDQTFLDLNKRVADMGDCLRIQPQPPTFDDATRERVVLMRSLAKDALDTWTMSFLRGEKEIDKDWDAFATEMNALGLQWLVGVYNADAH